jgi:FixJ family two-component response regulator
MKDLTTSAAAEGIGISLVDGDAGIRHARQIMLRSERYDVRSYVTCAALLADPRSRDYPCIVVDIASHDVDGISLLRKMRATGWRGSGILLDGIAPGSALMRDAERHGDKVLERTIGDGPLLTAIAISIDHGWATWNAVG